jgi:hypothetical protein
MRGFNLDDRRTIGGDGAWIDRKVKFAKGTE